MKSSPLLLLALALLAGCAKHAAPEPAGASLPAVRVGAARVEASQTPLFTEVPGTIRPARRYANAGDLAAPGQPLLELEGTADFQVEAGVPDSLVAGLAPGQALSVSGTAGFAATIAEISSSSDTQARTVTVKLAVPADAPVRSGQFVRVLVPAGQARTLLVPAAAVSLVGQMERVFVVQDGRAVLRLVKTGARHNGRVEILSGLGAGETVVAPSVAGLREGQPVEIHP